MATPTVETEFALIEPSENGITFSILAVEKPNFYGREDKTKISKSQSRAAQADAGTVQSTAAKTSGRALKEKMKNTKEPALKRPLTGVNQPSAKVGVKSSSHPKKLPTKGKQTPTVTIAPSLRSTRDISINRAK